MSMCFDCVAVTTTGTECDKIGVSYSAFRGQGARCDRSAGSCLSAQLEDYHKDGSYFVKDQGNVILGATRKHIFFSTNDKTL